MEKFFVCLFLIAPVLVSAAASSGLVPGPMNKAARESAPSDDEQVVIEIPSPGSPPVLGLELRKSSGSRTRGSRINLAAFSIELNRAGITQDDIDGAKEHIEQQLNLIANATPRSNRTIGILRQQLGEAVQLQKATLSESSGVKSSLGTTSSNSPRSDDDLSSALEDDREDESNEKTLSNMLIQLNIANQLVTQGAVRAQDALEQEKDAARRDRKLAYAGTVIGAVGIALSLVFGVVAIIPLI